MHALGHLISHERGLIDEWNWLVDTICVAAALHADSCDPDLAQLLTRLRDRLDHLDRRRVDLSLAIAHHPDPPFAGMAN